MTRTSRTQTAPDWLRTTVRLTQGQRATIRQVADALGVHPATVRRLVDSGKLEATKVGNKRFVSREAIERFLAVKTAVSP
jgi:excisionase family DNA binding protein